MTVERYIIGIASGRVSNMTLTPSTLGPAMFRAKYTRDGYDQLLDDWTAQVRQKAHREKWNDRWMGAVGHIARASLDSWLNDKEPLYDRRLKVPVLDALHDLRVIAQEFETTFTRLK